MRLASNESPYPPLPEVREAIERGAGHAQPLSGPVQRAAAPAPERPLRSARSRASRSATAPATSCWPPARRCSSRAPRSSTRGRRSRSTRTSPPPRARARSRSPLDDQRPPRPAGDAARDHRRDAPGDRLQPEQPDQHGAAARARSPQFLDEVPAARLRDRRRGLLRVQPARRPRRLDRAARAPPEPRAAAHLLEGPRPVRAARRLRAVRLRGSCRARSTRCASRSSATRSPRPPRSRRSPTRTRSLDRVARTVAERISVDERLRALGLEPADSQANFCWFELGEERDEQAVMARPARARRARARRRRARREAAALRVTYGTAEENARFLDALAEVCCDRR